VALSDEGASDVWWRSTLREYCAGHHPGAVRHPGWGDHSNRTPIMRGPLDFPKVTVPHFLRMAGYATPTNFTGHVPTRAQANHH